MADNNDVNVLLSVDLEASEALKQLAALRGETDSLRKDQKALDKSTAEGRFEYERLGAQIKANTKTIQQYERGVVNTLTQEKAQEGSIKSLRSELSNAKLAYSELSKTEREGAKGRELLDKTSALNAELKELESSYGDNQRKVGDYEIATKSLRQEMKELTMSLAEMTVQGQNESEEYKVKIARLAELKDAQGDVMLQATQMASDTATFDTITQGAQAATAAYGIWKAAATTVGLENEELEKTMQKLMVVMGALNSLTVLQNLAQKQSNIYRAASLILQKLGIKQTTAEALATSANAAAVTTEAAAEGASTVAKIKGIVVTKLATAAQWLWNAAMSENPVLLLVVAVAALIAGISALVGWINQESDSAKDARVAQEQYNIELEESEERLKKLEIAHDESTRSMQLSTRQRVSDLKKAGADEQTIRDAQAAGETELRNLEIRYNKQRQRESHDLIALKEQEIDFWIKAQADVRDGGKRWREYGDSINEARQELAELRATESDTELAIKELRQDQVEAEEEAIKAAADAARTRVDAAISEYTEEVEAQRAYNEARLKAEAAFQSTDFMTRKDYARKLFELNQSAELDRLDVMRKYHRITESDYAQSLAVMNSQLTEFSNAQATELNDFFKSEREAITGMLKETLAEQIAEVESDYADTLKRLESLEEPTILKGESEESFAKRLADYERFAVDQFTMGIRLEEEKESRIKAIREGAVAEQIKSIEQASAEAYGEDLAAFQGNERKKLDTTEAMLQERRAMLQAALSDAAGDADAELAIRKSLYDNELQLAVAAKAKIALNLQSELLLAGDNAKARYDANKAALEAELALAGDNADAILAIQTKLGDNERDLFTARMDNIAQYAQATADMMGGLNELFSAIDDAAQQKITERYEKDLAALDDARSRGTITEKKYNDEVLKIEKKKEKEEAKLKRDAAIRDRVSALFSIAMSTAIAVMNAMAGSTFTAGMPWTAIAVALGAVQAAAVLAAPLPKAARGGLISGPSHSAGGTIIEAEGGEAIMTRRAVSLFGPVLSAINELGGGVPFAGPLGDGGYTIRSVGSMRSASAAEIAEAMKGVKIYTTVEDINRGQEHYAEIQSGGTIF